MTLPLVLLGVGYLCCVVLIFVGATANVLHLREGLSPDQRTVRLQLMGVGLASLITAMVAVVVGYVSLGLMGLLSASPMALIAIFTVRWILTKDLGKRRD